MIEREKKLLVNKTDFEKMLRVAKELYPDISPKVVSQTNYYYDTLALSLYRKGITLRVREKNEKFVIEEKINRLYESDGTRVAEEKKTPIDALPEKIDSYSLLGQLNTERTRYSLPDGTNIDFDISRYFDVTDYEIEIEIGEAVPEEFISHLPAEPNNEMGKYSRFLSKKFALFAKGENNNE